MDCIARTHTYVLPNKKGTQLDPEDASVRNFYPALNQTLGVGPVLPGPGVQAGQEKYYARLNF